MKTQIEPHPDAPEGSVKSLRDFQASDFPATAAVLCRNTAPLITFAFDLLRRNVACHVVGRDIQIGLDRIIDKCDKGGSMNEFHRQLTAHRDAEVQKLIRKGKKEIAANYEDKCQALLVVAARCDSVPLIKDKLKQLFASGDGVTLSTIHKSKGLEWETVFLLDWHLLPSKYAEADWEIQQERNLQYVATTRAKLNLRFITTGNWNDQ